MNFKRVQENFHAADNNRVKTVKNKVLNKNLNKSSN